MITRSKRFQLFSVQNTANFFNSDSKRKMKENKYKTRITKMANAYCVNNLTKLRNKQALESAGLHEHRKLITYAYQIQSGDAFSNRPLASI